MKKTLAEQVAAYIAVRGSDYRPSDLAAEVAALQRDLPERKRCKRQNIEQLLDPGRGIRSPHYLPELAKAMGTTVEVLRAGTFDPGVGDDIRFSVIDAPSPISTLAPARASNIREVVAQLAQYLEQLDSSDREAAVPYLKELALHPERSELMSSKLERLLGEIGTPAQELAQIKTR